MPVFSSDEQLQSFTIRRLQCVIFRALTFNMLIFFSETNGLNLIKLGGYHAWVNAFSDLHK